MSGALDLGRDHRGHHATPGWPAPAAPLHPSRGHDACPIADKAGAATAGTRRRGWPAGSSRPARWRGSWWPASRWCATLVARHGGGVAHARAGAAGRAGDDPAADGARAGGESSARAVPRPDAVARWRGRRRRTHRSGARRARPLAAASSAAASPATRSSRRRRWNFSPRDAAGIPGRAGGRRWSARRSQPGETTPVAVQHVVRSFDPCMVCTVH
ncbi:MAG: nickel-dependent hydrogenase large subunit [Comamonadaceae bacterium]|nr:nickel-dependent hydrogenase large subunit [Comamonadaceae bacterium]